MTNENQGPSRGGRPLTGTVVKLKTGPHAGQLQGIVTLADGSRQRLPPFPRGTSLAMAKDKTLAKQEAARAAGITREAPKAIQLHEDSPMGKWIAAWNANRVAAGQTSTRDALAHYHHHILPSVGGKHVRDWTRDDMRKLCRDLDDKVRAKTVAWKTAINIWGTATKICNDASESKLDTLKCRDDDPSAGVRGPDKGDVIDLQFLYPSEFLQFVTCQQVPLLWRRVVALAVYSYARDGELRALSPRDVDVEHNRLSITKSIEKHTGEVGSPKGGRARHPAMEANLLPLVTALHGQWPCYRTMARVFRKWLRKAGLTRHELHHTTPTSRPIRFHDLRATGITWLAVRRDPPLEIQYRAGHRDFETTQKYIRLADTLRAGFGDVFPRLPAELIETTAPEVSITSFDHEPRFSVKRAGFGGEDGIRTRV